MESDPNNSYPNSQNSNSNIQIKGNIIITITQCKVKIENIILSENYVPPVNYVP